MKISVVHCKFCLDCCLFCLLATTLAAPSFDFRQRHKRYRGVDHLYTCLVGNDHLEVTDGLVCHVVKEVDRELTLVAVAIKHPSKFLVACDDLAVQVAIELAIIQTCKREDIIGGKFGREIRERWSG